MAASLNNGKPGRHPAVGGRLASPDEYKDPAAVKAAADLVARRKAAPPEARAPMPAGGRNPPRAGAAPRFRGAPLPLPEVPPAEPFPLDVLPPRLADYFRAEAHALAVPVDYVAAPALAVMGACIGATRAALVKPGYAEFPVLWVAVVAAPGSTKSAALARALAPLQRAEVARGMAHRDALEAHEAEADRYAAARAKWQKDGCHGDPPRKPDRPKRSQTRLDNFTKEAVVRVIDDDPRGVVVAKDELTGFVGQLNAYRGGKGDDKEFFLSGWAGASYVGNRSGGHEAGPLVIPRVFLAVAGMIPPARLPALFCESPAGGPTGDGWADRFLTPYPDALPAAGETWATVPPELAAVYAGVVDKLLALEMAEDDRGERSAVCAPLDAGARRAWERFTGGVAAQMNDLDPADPFRGVLSKLRGYCARLACILHQVRLACGEPAGASIGADTLERAARLAGYFGSHYRRCRGATDADPAARLAARLAGHLLRRPQAEMTQRDAQQWLKGGNSEVTVDDLQPALEVLLDRNYLAELPAGPGPGHKSRAFAVNPLLHAPRPAGGPPNPPDRPGYTALPPADLGDLGDDFAGPVGPEVAPISPEARPADLGDMGEENPGPGAQPPAPQPAPAKKRKSRKPDDSPEELRGGGV